MYHDLEAVLAKKMEEHEVLEAQFTTEHEEEVRALRQQKRQLMQKLEEVQQHYQNILDNQEDQVSFQYECNILKLPMFIFTEHSCDTGTNEQERRSYEAVEGKNRGDISCIPASGRSP